MQIKINLKIFLFIIIFIITRQIEIYGWIMLFAFIHEIGHMLTGMALKLKPKTLNFMPFGISITFEDYGYKKLMEVKKIIIAMMGPLTNLLIAIILIFFNINTHIKEMIFFSNILIAIFNLIPLYPLDGGRILKGIMRLKYKKEEADDKVNKISNILIILITAISSIVILYLKNLAILFILVYLWVMEIKENKKYSIKKAIYKALQKNKKCIDI